MEIQQLTAIEKICGKYCLAFCTDIFIFKGKTNFSNVCSSKSYLKWAFVTTAVSNNMHNSTPQQHWVWKCPLQVSGAVSLVSGTVDWHNEGLRCKQHAVSTGSMLGHHTHSFCPAIHTFGSTTSLQSVRLRAFIVWVTRELKALQLIVMPLFFYFFNRVLFVTSALNRNWMECSIFLKRNCDVFLT